MIADISTTIMNLLGALVIYRSVTNVLVDGESVKRYSIEKSVQAAVVPLSGLDLKNSPDGIFSTEDKIIISATLLQNGDIVKFNDNWFEVRNTVDVKGIFGIYKYLAKRIGSTEVLIGEDNVIFYDYRIGDFVLEFENGLLNGA